MLIFVYMEYEASLDVSFPASYHTVQLQEFSNIAAMYVSCGNRILRRDWSQRGAGIRMIHLRNLAPTIG